MSQGISEDDLLVLDQSEEVITIQHEREIFAITNRNQDFSELKNVSTDTHVSSGDIGSNTLKSDRQCSKIWNHFTIVSKEHFVAVCNICDTKHSFKTSITNLKKHLIRKHPTVLGKAVPTSFTTKPKRPNLSELGGIDSFILNAVADGGSTVEIEGQEVEASEVNGHSSYIDEGNIADSAIMRPRVSNRFEKTKTNRMLDLQMECLELKKYTMQMESLLLERQLNLPRSIYTENLQGCDNVTRGTQTDLGGGNIKVYDIADPFSRESTKHLFHFQDKRNREKVFYNV